MSDSIGEKVKRWRELCDDGRTWDVGRVALCEAADEVERLAGFEHAWLLANVRLARLEEALRWYAEEAHKPKDVYGAGMNSLPQYLWYDDRGDMARRALAEEKP